MHLLFVIVIVGQISDDLTLIKPLQLWHNHCFWMNHIEHKPPWNLRQMCNYASFSKEMQMHIVATNGPSSLLLLDDTRRPKSRRAKHSWMFIHCVKTRLTLLIKEVNSQVFMVFENYSKRCYVYVTLTFWAIFKQCLSNQFKCTVIRISK